MPALMDATLIALRADTNFEVGDLNFFRAEAYQSLFRALDATNGFVERRWGDAPFRTLAIETLAPRGAVIALRHPAYVHPWHPATPDDANLARAFKIGIVGSRDELKATCGTAHPVSECQAPVPVEMSNSPAQRRSRPAPPDL